MKKMEDNFLAILGRDEEIDFSKSFMHPLCSALTKVDVVEEVDGKPVMPYLKVELSMPIAMARDILGLIQSRYIFSLLAISKKDGVLDG